MSNNTNPSTFDTLDCMTIGLHSSQHSFCASITIIAEEGSVYVYIDRIFSIDPFHCCQYFFLYLVDNSNSEIAMYSFSHAMGRALLHVLYFIEKAVQYAYQHRKRCLNGVGVMTFKEDIGY